MGSNNPRREILPLPDVLEPADTICFCIEIPDNEDHIAAFWGAIGALGKRYSWGKPLTADSDLVAQYWLKLIEDNYSRFRELY